MNFEKQVKDQTTDYLKILKNKELPRLKCFIITSSYYINTSKKLLNGALSCLEDLKIPKPNLYEAPGTLEIPQFLNHILTSKNNKTSPYQFGVALGVVLQGETDHNRLIVNHTYSSLINIATKYDLPIGIGIISADKQETINKRTASNNKNYGYIACLHAVYSYISQKNIHTSL